MFERIGDDARRVLIRAGQEAEVMGDREVGPEHLLLGVMYEGEGVATKALAALGVGLDDVVDAVLALRRSN